MLVDSVRVNNSQTGHHHFDLRLGRRILEGMTVSVEASNVFDRQVEELDGIPLPGRWLSLSLTWRPGAP